MEMMGRCRTAFNKGNLVLKLLRKILVFKKGLQAMEGGQSAKEEKGDIDTRQHTGFIHLFIGL